jgi:hypothetical protein
MKRDWRRKRNKALIRKKEREESDETRQTQEIKRMSCLLLALCL